jgi:hypothetical protein
MQLVKCLREQLWCYSSIPLVKDISGWVGNDEDDLIEPLSWIDIENLLDGRILGVQRSADVVEREYSELWGFRRSESCRVRLLRMIVFSRSFGCFRVGGTVSLMRG